MDPKMKALNAALTQMYKREDDLYHRYGAFMGLSDPAVWVLYGLYEDPERVLTQNDLVAAWFYPKQTISYTVNALAKKGWVKSEQLPGAGNSKAVLLTEEGLRVCQEKILPLMQAEERSLKRLSEEEQALLLHLTKKQFSYFEEEVHTILGENSETK